MNSNLPAYLQMEATECGARIRRNCAGFVSASGMFAAAVVEKWVQADADGRLPEPLTAPKAGASGFYRVIVTDRCQE